MKELATWALIFALACPPPAFVWAQESNPSNKGRTSAAKKDPKRDHAECKEGNCKTVLTGRKASENPVAGRSSKPLDPEIENLKTRPLCSEEKNDEAETMLFHLEEKIHPIRWEQNYRYSYKTDNIYPDGGKWVPDTTKRETRLAENFESKVTELLSWALKCRAARGGALAKPTWLELQLVDYLKEKLPQEISGLRINPIGNKGFNYSSKLATSEFREDVLYLQQLSQTFEFMLQAGFKDREFSVALTEQLDEYSKARKENRDPRMTPKLKAFTKTLSESMKAEASATEEGQELTDGHTALAGMLLGANPFNEHVLRKDPPLFDSVFGNFLGASYRKLLLTGEPKATATDAPTFSFNDMPLDKKHLNQDLFFVTNPGSAPHTRNGMRNARGNSPTTEWAPFWGSEKQDLAGAIYQLSWEDREKLRNWVKDKLARIENGKMKLDDPLAFESLIQLARIIDSPVDETKEKGHRISPKRPALAAYYAGILAEARTASDPANAQALRDLEKVRSVFEKKTSSNLTGDARWRFLTLPSAERQALTRWAEKTTDQDKELLRRLLTAPNRNEIVVASYENTSLAKEIYKSIETELKDKVGDWSEEDRARLNRVFAHLKSLNMGSPQEQLTRQEELREDAEVMRTKLGEKVIALSEEAQKTPSSHGAADAAALLYNHLSETRLDQNQVRQLDIAGYDKEGNPQLFDHYSQEATVESLKENPKDLFSDPLLSAFIEEIYGKGAVIPDYTRRVLKELMGKDHEIHRTMLRRIKDIVKHRKGLTEGNGKSVPEQLLRDLLVEPAPEMIESVLKKLNSDAYRLYADVEQYQAVRQGIEAKIKKDPSKFAADKIGSEEFNLLAKYSIAQSAALMGKPMDHIVTDQEIVQRARVDLFNAGRIAEEIGNKSELSNEDKESLSVLENAFKHSGLGEVKGAKRITESLMALLEKTEKADPGNLSETEMRLVLLLNGELGGGMNVQYGDISRETARKVLSQSNGDKTKALAILKSQIPNLLRPMNSSDEEKALQDLTFNASVHDRLKGALEVFEKEDLLPNLYKKRRTNDQTISDGLDAYYRKVDLLKQLELKEAEKRVSDTTEDLYIYKYEHRRDPKGTNTKLEDKKREEDRKGSDQRMSSTRADNWLRGLKRREADVEEVNKELGMKQADLQAIINAKDADIARVWAAEAPLKLAYRYLHLSDEAEKKKFLEALDSPPQGDEPGFLKDQREIISQILKDSKGKDPALVMDLIARLLGQRHIESLPKIPHGKAMTAEDKEKIKRGYQDFAKSIYDNQKELTQRQTKRNALIETIIKEKYKDVLDTAETTEEREALFNALGEEIMAELQKNGHLEEQLRVYGAGMQTALDVSELNPGDSKLNLTRNYNENIQMRLKRALINAPGAAGGGASAADQRLNQAFEKSSLERAKKDKSFLEARKKWEAIGGKFNGLDAVLGDKTDLSHSTSQQMENTLSEMSKAGVGLTIDIPGLRNYHTKDPIGAIKAIARNLAIQNAADQGRFMMPVNSKTAMTVEIDSETGDMKISQSSLPKEEAKLKECMDKVGKAFDEHFKATNYAKTWTHTWAQLSENIFWRQSVFGAERWTHDGFDAETRAFNAYMRAVNDCKRYGAVSVGDRSARDFVSNETRIRAQNAVNRSKDAVNEFMFKVDVVNDAGWIVIGSVATFGIGSALGAGATGTRLALAANTAKNTVRAAKVADRISKLNRLERLAFGTANLLNKSKYGEKIVETALQGYYKAAPIANRALWGHKSSSTLGTLFGGGVVKEAAFGQALNLLSLPQYGAMYWQLNQDYAKAEELYRTGKFNQNGFGGDEKKWEKFKQTVDQNDNGIPDSIDSIGPQWVWPDAATANGWLGSSINFGAMGGLGPITQALKVPRLLHVPLFSGGAIDDLRNVAHGRKNWNEFREDRIDSVVHLGPGLILMELPIASRLFAGLGKAIKVPNLAEKQILWKGPSVAQAANTGAILYANHSLGDHALVALGRKKKDEPKDDKTWLDWVATDLPNWGQEFYFAYRMAGAATQRHIRTELSQLNKGGNPLEKLAALEKGHGRDAVLGAVATLPPSQILKARTDNPTLFELARHLNPNAPLSADQLYEALEIYQNKEKSEVLKKKGIDPEKLYREGALPKTWWDQMRSGLSTASHIADNFNTEPQLQEALPKLLRDHAAVVQRAYERTEDLEFRAKLADYMKGIPTLASGLPAGSLNIDWKDDTKAEELSKKQEMDLKLLYEAAIDYNQGRENKRGLERKGKGKADGLEPFATGFIRFARVERSKQDGATKTIGELLQEYNEIFSRPEAVRREIEAMRQPGQKEFMSTVTGVRRRPRTS